MNYVANIATEQGFAFLVGLALLVVIQPTTPGGAILLIMVAVAVVNVIIQVLKLFKIISKKHESQPRED
jgi:hypothetical protein